ncbi:MAG: hypothetical protein ABID64_02525 [Nitrospirota bacterium]
MPIFSYTVANKEGKKLSGTVEAPDEQTARIELNNLGFSILDLKETQEAPQVDSKFTKFVFEAIDKNSKLVSGTIPAENEEDAFFKLKSEYALTVSALWKEGADEKEIAEARKKGTQTLQNELVKEEEQKVKEDLKQQKEEQFTKTKIEYILKEVHNILQTFDRDINMEKKAEINKRLNKILRIKQSKNLNYILASAEDLLKYIQEQEKTLKEQGKQEKQLELHIRTKKLLDELNKSSSPKSISDDIITKIGNWEQAHTGKKEKEKATTLFIGSVLARIKSWFTTPPQFAAIKEQIKVYNRQLWEFVKLYFKEPAPEYKAKVKASLKTIWKARKKAIHSLAQAKKLLKDRRNTEQSDDHIIMSFIEELNTLTGWLLAFYLIYYIVSLYITTKSFGLTEIPQAFFVYDSQLFKFILAIIFLLHATTSLKVNFFKKSVIASFILLPVFLFGSIVVLLNF